MDDFQVDVLVVGAGNAAACAALCDLRWCAALRDLCVEWLGDLCVRRALCITAPFSFLVERPALSRALWSTPGASRAARAPAPSSG